MLRIGLTGGIGSGKSTVSQRFAHHGIVVVDADAIAHSLTRRGEPAFDNVVRTFGKAVIGADGQLDRVELRRRVFQDPAQRQTLERLLHPLIRSAMQKRVATAGGPYCVLAIPLLIENHQNDLVDRVLVVDAPESRRIDWVKRRSGLSTREVRQIIAAQATRAERLAAADDVIENDGTVTELNQEVDRLHERYLRLAATTS